MIIRPLEPEDRPVIAGIHAKSWQQSYRQQMPVDFLDNDLPGEMQARWRDIHIGAKDIVLVAENATAIIGFVAAWDDEPVYLDNLHVVKDHRSRGTGRLLMGNTAMKARDNGRKQIDLHVVTGNVRAKKLYMDMGGVLTAEENKDLCGIAVPHYRISWPDISTLIEKTNVS